MVVEGEIAAGISNKKLVAALSERYREELARDGGKFGPVNQELKSRLLRDGLDQDGAEGLSHQLTAELTGFGVLQEAMDDPEVSEIMVNGTDQVFVEKRGEISSYHMGFRDVAHIRTVLERLLAGSGRRVDDARPLVDASVGDGFRLNAVLPPVSEVPLITIRKTKAVQKNLDFLLRAGALNSPMAAFLHAAVIAKFDLVVSGGAGAGKTTVLSALAHLIPPDQRLLVLEDTREVGLVHPHAVSLQCRPVGGEGSTPISMRDLVKNSLRMRPDRILVGEIRGAEVADLVMAMNTGHEGCMTTVHANSAADVLDRLRMMMSLAWAGVDESSMSRWLTSALDLVIHCERDGTGKRRIVEVAVVDEGMPCPIYRFDRQKVVFASCGNPAERVLEKMRAQGIDFPEDLLS